MKLFKSKEVRNVEDEAIIEKESDKVSYYVFFDKLGGCMCYQPFSGRNNAWAIRTALLFTKSQEFIHKLKEVSLYKVFILDTAFLTVEPCKEFICHGDELEQKYEQMLGEL